jgi:hypothetical protein
LVLGSGIGLLLSGGTLAGAASTQTASLQKIIEIRQRRDGCARRADLHADAGRRVQHPLGQDSEHAGRHLDVDEPAGLAALDPLDPHAPPEKRMPAVVDDGKLPDMGRMDG